MAITILKSNNFSEYEGETFLDIFDHNVKVYIEQGADVEYAERCVAYLNALDEEVLDTLCRAAIKYCNEFLEDIGGDIIEFATPRDVLSYITPNTICIPNPKNKNEPVIDLEFNCTWEEEHGMEWIIRDGKAMYVGPYNGINPYGDCDFGQDWNYI